MRERLPTTAFVRASTAAVLALVTALAAGLGTAAASRTQRTMLQDDAQLVYGSQSQRAKRLDELRRLGVDIVKVRLSWRAIAPGGKRKPKGFDGSKPAAYPAGRWDPYDAIVRGARARGLTVLLQLGGSAPEWATPGKSAVRSPNAKEFGRFVKAVGTRYSGSYGGAASGGGGGLPIPLPGGTPSGATPLPRVSLYSAWNEPNLVSWLAPQYRKGVPYAPAIYRRLLSAASAGLKGSGHGGDQLLIGELLPYARSGEGRRKVRPLAFLRELGCVNRRFKPYRGRAAKKRGCTHFHKVPGTGLAYHPYTLAGGPGVRTPNRDDASIANLGRVTKTLDRLGRRGRFARHKMPLWISEFGFQSRPPDRYAAKLGRVPGFMAQSEWLAFRSSRVVSYAQYPLVDDRGRNGFQSGLRFKSGKAKRGVYSAFRHTFRARRLSSSRVDLFGCERAATSGTVTIEARRGRKGKWKAVGAASVNRAGYFHRRLKLSGASRKRYRYRFATSHSRVVAPARR